MTAAPPATRPPARSTGRRLVARTAASVVATLPPTAVRRLPPGARARAQLLLNRALKRSPRTFAAAPTCAGVTVDGTTSDLIQRYLYVFGVWEPDLTHWVQEHLRPGDVVVDVGANIGWFSLLAATAVGPAGHVVAFEPVPTIADMLERNVRRNGLQVDVHRAVVGDVAGHREVFRSSGSNLGRSGTAGGDGARSEGAVPAVRGDEALPADLWSRIRLVKVDVEGDEHAVLTGLRPVLAAMPVGSAVLVEITPADLVARGTSPSAVVDSMAALGFRGYAIRNSYAAEDYARYERRRPVPLTTTPSVQTDVVFVKETP